MAWRCSWVAADRGRRSVSTPDGELNDTDATFVDVDLDSSNGVIHVIDSLLLPS